MGFPILGTGYWISTASRGRGPAQLPRSGDPSADRNPARHPGRPHRGRLLPEDRIFSGEGRHEGGARPKAPREDPSDFEAPTSRSAVRCGLWPKRDLMSCGTRIGRSRNALGGALVSLDVMEWAFLLDLPAATAMKISICVPAFYLERLHMQDSPHAPPAAGRPAAGRCRAHPARAHRLQRQRRNG